MDLGAPWIDPETVYLSAGAIDNGLDKVYCQVWQSDDGGNFEFLCNIPDPVENGTVKAEFRRTKRYVQVKVFIEPDVGGMPALLSAIITRD